MYRIPDPKIEPLKAIVIFYKIMKGIEYDDRGWDRIHFARNMKSAEVLYSVLDSFSNCRSCIESIGKDFNSKDFPWTLETIVKHCHEWKRRRGGFDESKTRQRFLDALARQRSDDEAKKKGEITTAGEVLSTLRDMPALRDIIGSEDGSRNESDGTDY